MKHVADKVLAAEKRKLGKAIDSIVTDFGLRPRERGSSGREYVGYSIRFACPLNVTFYLHATEAEGTASNPWLACCFDREPLYKPWVMGDPRNVRYGDIRDALADSVNVYTGKYNSHTWKRATAEEIERQWRAHLRAALTPPPPVEPTPAQRLEYLRGELRAERISQGELLELQGLAAHIQSGDVELLEAAGVPEFPEGDGKK